ncbi:hypothetical protein [Enterococcus faecalis]|jgi:hypothetical protein|uniref:HK97 gp10 family phage protein n=1 Tax=Enterococcus faecalis ATCC 6055 TaxID=1169311 RepID=R3IE66_ENTFL|nr:hypothetical protein [Enterococcus faecalis]EGO2798139.1 hypothetical protein [Enterococcus faecalis]EGO8260404.1 hypothetical protein [Enterococcus faecalis]EHR4738390.1 hypothetical protein [Enterococcus faecalis]EIX2479470.1 hypothetical protein [Enterococcus faecalis]EJM6076932.1 hypothetical protein [Enterococcus faecalis]
MSAAFNTSTAWDVEFVDLDKLRENMMKIPGSSETIINQVLRTKSAEMTAKTIISGMPVSDVKNRIMKRKHAKFSNSLKIDYMNLGFKERPQKRFEYLKYPDLGIGTSIGKVPQEFMRKGMEKEVPVITKDLNEALINEINKNIGGN